ncbi:MAG: excinuclease ABC subunit UvrA, partial [Candidatus Binatia bacterium]
ITGLSGSGKSSLAFDTIYAEGQRRYVESLSAYARQFLDQLEKPDVDSVEGLSPAISIEQKTVSRSPRSTVGTVTEIYDYLRLLFSSIGQPHCHQCGAPIARQSVEQIVFGILSLPEGERVMILAPIVRGRKGEFKKELEKLHKDGFVRARIDGEMRQLDEDIVLDKRKNHTIEVVVDRLLIKTGVNERLTESVRTALKLTGGAVLISIVDGEEKLYSERMACVNCGINIAPLEPRSFSFNSAFGACKRCQGIGTIMEIDKNKIVTDPSMATGRVKFLNDVDRAGSRFLQSAMRAILDRYTDGDKLEPPDEMVSKKNGKRSTGTASTKVVADLLATPFSDLPSEIREAFFNGTKRRLTFAQEGYKYESDWKGALRAMRDRMENPPSERVRAALEELVAPIECPACEGRRLQPESLAVKVGGLGIADYTAIPIDDSSEAISRIRLTNREEKIAGLILKEIRDRLKFLSAVA